MRWLRSPSTLRALSALLVGACLLSAKSALTLTRSTANQPIARAEEIVDFACGSTMLNVLVASGAKGRPTEYYATPTRKFREVGTAGTFVIWGGPLQQQSFSRSLKLPATFIDDLVRFPPLRGLADLPKIELERMFTLDVDNISSDEDHIDAGGGTIFFEFIEGKLKSVAIDCGQIEPYEN